MEGTQRIGPLHPSLTLVQYLYLRYCYYFITLNDNNITLLHGVSSVLRLGLHDSDEYHSMFCCTTSNCLCPIAVNPIMQSGAGYRQSNWSNHNQLKKVQARGAQ
jgi:hypothetical protein